MATLMKRLLQAMIILAACAITGFVVTFMLTPLLWKLEEPLGLELAGHSGPADWIFLTVIGLFCLLGLGAWAILGPVRNRTKRPD